jgi:hypothetical protein
MECWSIEFFFITPTLHYSSAPRLPESDAAFFFIIIPEAHLFVDDLFRGRRKCRVKGERLKMSETITAQGAFLTERAN